MKKIVLTNIWGAAGFIVPNFIHVLKESTGNSALKTVKKSLMLQVWKLTMCTYGSDFYYFSTCA